MITSENLGKIKTHVNIMNHPWLGNVFMA